MADTINVQVTEDDIFSVRFVDDKVVTVSSDSALSSSLGDLPDVDVINAQDGSVLVYRLGVRKWSATTTLDSQNMEGGEY